jgi:hypothetical protein
VAAARSGDTASVLLAAATPAAMAGALAWAQREGADRLVLFCDEGPGAGTLARQAVAWRFSVEVRTVVEATSVPAVADAVAVPAPAPTAPDLEALLHDRGLEVVDEHGVVRGEVLGLEVARIVEWPVELGGDGALHLEAGVGRFDRDAAAAMHGGEPAAAALDRAVRTVRAHRFPGAPTHPLSLLARDRWLRAILVADPGPVGAVELSPVATTMERRNVRDPAPAAAVGRTADGEAIVVVTAIGADLSLVPVADDTRRLHAPSARLVLAVPRRDVLPALGRLADELEHPAAVVGVDEPWGVT